MKRLLFILLTIFAFESTEVFAAASTHVTRRVGRCAEDAIPSSQLKRGREEDRQLTREIADQDARDEGDVFIPLNQYAEVLASMLAIEDMNSDIAHHLNYVCSDAYLPSRRMTLTGLVAEAHRKYPVTSAYNSLWDFIAAIKQSSNQAFYIFIQEFETLMCALTTTNNLNPYANILLRDIFSLDTQMVSSDVATLANTICSEKDSAERYQALIEMITLIYPTGEFSETFIQIKIAQAKLHPDLVRFFS